MGFTKRCAAVLVIFGAAQAALAAPHEELADLATRVDYGFYGDEPRVIEAARESLERLAAHDDQAHYYLAFGAFRLAQLRSQDGAEPSAALLDSCSDDATTTAEKAQKGAAAAESWVLAAACAALAGEQRRRDQALERARALDPKNPRVALLEAWTVSLRPAQAAPAVRDAAALQLEESIAAFEAARQFSAAAGWGEPEALAQLGEIALARGEPRKARDFVERALLLAPDYRFAVDLRGKVQSGGRARE